MRNGFTLVELSIVLVIIGLLIGGILVGQSLIESAKISATVRQLEQYNVAVSLFKDKYRKLPGDSSLFYSLGNNDGNINAGTNDDALIGEVANFWSSLSASNMINETYPAIPATNVTVGRDMPQLEVGEQTGIVAGYVYDHSGNTFYQNNVWFIADFNMATSSMTSSGIGKPLLGTQAGSLDIKMDDGKSSTGNIRAPYYSGHEFGYQPDPGNCRSGSGSTAVYGSGSSNFCALHILLEPIN